MSTPKETQKPKPNKFLDFGPQSEELKRKAKEQVDAGRRQYLASLRGHNRGNDPEEPAPEDREND